MGAAWRGVEEAEQEPPALGLGACGFMVVQVSSTSAVVVACDLSCSTSWVTGLLTTAPFEAVLVLEKESFHGPALGEVGRHVPRHQAA